MRRMKAGAGLSQVRKYLAILTVSWILIVLCSMLWNLQTLDREIFNQAKSIARGAFNKDVAYRSWNSGHGGVYVPVTPENQPNPYLQVPNREIITTSGIEFTKIYSLPNHASISSGTSRLLRVRLPSGTLNTRSSRRTEHALRLRSGARLNSTLTATSAFSTLSSQT